MSRKAVVIGDGVDALVAARMLSGAYEVSVVPELDSADEGVGWVAPQVRRALRIDRLALEAPDPWAVAPLPQGGRLELWRDLRRSVEAIRRVSEKDAQQWPRFCARMAKLARFLEKVYLEPPPEPLGLRFAARARLLGRQGLIDLLRLLPMSIAELLDDWFENDTLKGVLGASGLSHLQQGPRSAGTAFVFLHHHAGCAPGVFRPPRANLREALAALPALATHRAAATAIRVSAGRATHVVLADGTEIAAALVVSGINPRRTLLELVDPVWLDPELVRGVRHVRSRGVVARVALQLDRSPGFTNLVLAPSLDYLERAYDDSKYGGISQRPYLEARCDPRHRVDVHAQFVPEGADHAALGDVAAAMLSEHFGDAVITTSRVLASREAAPHAELTLDQALWMRPHPELAHYHTPIEGLWLCGPAMHPGHGVPGACGYNAARAVLKGGRRAA